MDDAVDIDRGRLAMTLNADSKEESKSDIASIDDTIDNSQDHEDDEKTMNEKESNPGNVEQSLDTDKVREESGETSPADESAAKEEKNEQAAVATADKKGANSDISLSSIRSKKKKQKIDPKNMIQTPNVHDVLLGRGKPVSCLFVVINLREYLYILNVLSNRILLCFTIVSKPRRKPNYAKDCRYVSQAISRVRTSI